MDLSEAEVGMYVKSRLSGCIYKVLSTSPVKVSVVEHTGSPSGANAKEGEIFTGIMWDVMEPHNVRKKLRGVT